MQLFDLIEVGKGKFRGPQPDTQWQRLFGGQVMAQSLVAEAGVDLVCAASTARPLLGLDSVLAVAPDLEPI